MRRLISLAAFACFAVSTGPCLHSADGSNQPKLIVLDPGHFHASLIQEDMYPSLAAQVSVYAPLGPDVMDYLQRIERFNTRKENPTSWKIELHTGPDFLERMLQERPGNLVIISGRNRPKIDRIVGSVGVGLNVLADKPWIIRSADLPKVARALDEAETKHLVAYDIMTERYEIASILQRELVEDAEVFGKVVAGSDSQPGISAKSVHHLMKMVAGAPLRRPAWFFDVAETGEGLADVGTHVVDLVQWTAFPGEMMDYRTDVRILGARHWPTVIPKADFQRVTGEPDFPPYLAGHVKDGKFEYYCNNSVHYTVRGVHVKLDVLWNWEAPGGSGDTYEATFRGTKARVEIRQGKAEAYVPEVYVVPESSARAEVFAALKRKMKSLEAAHPGVELAESAGEAHIVIPKRLRSDREHFADVANQFFAYLQSPEAVPAWEKANMLVKYYVTTKGVEAAQ